MERISDVMPDMPGERSDAARNRALLLDAAAALVAERGVDGVTMDELARRAGVGKGTVFRRFGSRAGLMHALLDRTEQDLQAAFLFGPPPLGPGANPIDRLIAFGRARLEMVELEGDLLVAGEKLKFATAPYFTSAMHVGVLLRDAKAQGDIALLADSLMATLDPTLVLHQIRNARFPLGRIIDNWTYLVRQLAEER